MAADFPTNVVNLPNKSDGEKFYGVEYNKIVDEITAIETELKKPAAETIVQAADSAKLDGNDSAYFMPASYADGWIPVSATWTYASATTITVPSGAAAIYKVGQGIKLTQTDVKYFYIVGVADTLLTITGGSDYTLTGAAISAVSYTNTPGTAIGFPKNGFSLGTPTWTTSGTPFTNQPVSNNWKLTIASGMATITGQAQLHATSGGTGMFVATFTTGYLPAIGLPSAGSAINFNTLAGGVSSANASNILRVAKIDGSAIATNSEYIGAVLSFRI